MQKNILNKTRLRRVRFMEHKTLFFEDEKLNLIDQRILPLKIQYYTAETYEEVCEAIKKMVVRGSPCDWSLWSLRLLFGC